MKAIDAALILLVLLTPTVALEQSLPPTTITDLGVRTPLPPGATFNQTTGKFSWTPTAEQKGVHYFEFSAYDTKGGWDSEIMTITVE